MTDILSVVEKALDVIISIPPDSLPTPSKARQWEIVAETLQIARMAALERSGAIWQALEEEQIESGNRRCSACRDWHPVATLTEHSTGYGSEPRPAGSLIGAKANPVDRGNHFAYCVRCQEKHG